MSFIVYFSFYYYFFLNAVKAFVLMFKEDSLPSRMLKDDQAVSRLALQPQWEENLYLLQMK